MFDFVALTALPIAVLAIVMASHGRFVTRKHVDFMEKWTDELAQRERHVLELVHRIGLAHNAEPDSPALQALWQYTVDKIVKPGITNAKDSGRSPNLRSDLLS